ncbi:hypothetical protein PAT3040_03959 [Paenibacillus agaridevorans]|uniref:Uncharacterized protein n=1 Tax=Paenibacillus agaridevorans TaxID=171404 RepID=A0A2R5ET56_9BACL|nr:hypothetical protein [Paenibacillus agaridevorans]GBG09315.1 hypothetical protein PAT3040_03959 [Paenibacillus agaridevorans]
MKRKLAWFDLLHAESDNLQDLWLTELQNVEFVENTERPHYEEDFRTATVPVLHDIKTNTNEKVPQELIDALQEKHPDSDYGSGKTYRKIGGSWYVLLDRHFLKYEAGVLTELGEMPVSVSISISEGFGGNTARDFIRQDEAWIVADTEGSRILKLNDELEIVDEVAVSTPYKLTASNGGLYVDSLGRTLRVNEDWTEVTETPSSFSSTTNVEKASLRLRLGDYQEDSETGLTWYYVDGRIYQHHIDNQTYRSFFVGYNENYPGSSHLIQMEQEMLVLMDRRVDRFDSEGNWLGRIEFPRSRPDGIYDSTSGGENTYVLDDENQMLYLVQGYRILAIDLQAGQHTEVFRQNYGDIGKLHRFNDELYFLFHSYYGNRYDVYQNGEAAREKFHTEVVKLGLDGSSVQRFYVDTFFDTMMLQEGTTEQPTFVLTSYKYQ